MAIKALMLRRRIDAATQRREALAKEEAELAAREKELTVALDEAGTDEELDAVETEVNAHAELCAANIKALAAADEELHKLRAELEAEEAAQKTTPPAAETGANHLERTVCAMSHQINIRTLAKNRRAFEAAYTLEQRQAIVAQDDTKEFLAHVRTLGASKPFARGEDLTIPIVLLDLITENMYRYSKLLNRVRVRTVRGEARQNIAGLVPPAVWTECGAAINELTFSFGQYPMNCWKLAGFVPLSNSVLNDSDINLAATLVEMISMSLGMSKDMAILYGTGNGMPLGIVTRLAQTSKPGGYPATAPDWVDLHSSNIVKIDGTTLSGAAFWAALRVATGKTFTRYSRGELFWAMNSKTYAYLESKAIATTTTGEWVALIGGKLPIVSGDIDVLEFMPDYDVVGGYGDLYLWAQREGTTLGADDVGYTNRVKDQTIYFGKERADGAPIVPGAFVAINLYNLDVTTSLSDFPSDTANDSSLQALSIGETLSPTFASGTLTYTATASNASDTILATPNQNDAHVSITHTAGSTVKNVINGSTVTWATGSNVLAITVRQGNGVRVYTVTVTKN